MNYLETAVAYRAIDNLKTLIGTGPTPALQAQAFTRQAIAKAMGMGDDEARSRWGDAGPIIVKATIDALSRADIDPEARAFLGLAVERSVLGRLLGLRRVPFDIRVSAVASGALGHFVAEAAPVPLSRQVLEGSTLKPATVAGIVVCTKESLGNPLAESLVQEDLLNAVAGVLDVAFLSADPGVPGERPAGIAHDAPSIAATGNLADDLASLLEIYGGDLLTSAFVTTPAVAVRLALAAGGNPQIDLGPNGGRLFGVPTYTTRHIAPTSNGSPLLMVDAGGIVANWESIELAQSGHTSLVMADNPTAPAQVVSMFQTNSIAFKSTVHAAWDVAREGSVAILEGM
jgi:hypothetical protein